MRALGVIVLAACSSRAAAPPPPPPPADPPALAGDAAMSPADAAAVARPGWADVAAVIPDAVLDLRYATAANFTGAPLYPVARCWLRERVAARLARAADELRRAGHRIVLWDCYRPASIQRELWRRVPDPRYVAEPRFDDAGRPIGGSKHSRGAAVDISLADAAGTPRVMPTDHDAFGPAASGAEATGAAARHHAALRAAMIAAGFEPMATEWWHYDAADWPSYPLADDPL